MMNEVYLVHALFIGGKDLRKGYLIFQKSIHGNFISRIQNACLIALIF